MLVDRRFLFGLLAIFASPVSSQNIIYLSRDEALALEHKTRFARLKRWAETFGVREPEFYDYTIPANAMPADYPHDVPVLRIVFPESTFFDTASATVKDGALPMIRAMAQTLDGDVPDVSVFVAGHTDGRGDDAYNHNLSIRRARAVAELLNQFEHRDTPLWSIGFGKSVPLYPNTSDANMAFNRRVEFLLAARPDAIALWLQDQSMVVCPSGTPVERVSCMIDFKTERPKFVAEPVVRKRVAPTTDTKVRVTPTAKSTVRVQPTEQQKITITLNEKPIHVRSIEH